MIKLKGVRDIQTLYGRTHCAQDRSRTRAQIASELAYLEREKDRLDRESARWLVSQRQAESRLGFVRTRITLLQEILGAESPSKRQAPESEDESGDDIQRARTPLQEIPFEY